MTETSKPREIAHRPPEISRLVLDEVARRRQHPTAGTALGLPNVDAKLKPLRPGDLMTIIARPSHYKSGLAQWWARRLAQQSLDEESDEVVVYTTWEMAIEELGIYDLSAAARLDASEVANGQLTDDDWAALQAAAMRRSALPLWYVGHSLANRKKRLRLTLWTVERALIWIEDNMQFRCRALFLDYLNLIQPERELGGAPNMRTDLTEIVRVAKDLALELGCPVILLAQAHRRVDERMWKLPQMADAMETSSIEQYSDVVASLWMPKVTEPLGTTLTPPGSRDALEVTPNLLLLGLVKQKKGPAGGFWPLYVDPTRNFVGPMDTRDEEEMPW